MKKLTVLIPVYNSENIFPVLYERLIKTFQTLNYECSILVVVDGHKDNSWSVISSLAENDNKLKVIQLSRNYGQQSALTIGMDHFVGDFLIVMDDDLEDPPEFIPNLLKRSEDGYDVVYAVRKKRKVSIIKKICYRSFYRILNHLSDTELPNDAGDFCLMKKEVVEALLKLPEKNRYIRGMRSWVGFKQTGIKYERQKRLDGKSGFSLKQYFLFAFNAIFSFSYKPLHYITYLGIFSSALSIVLICWIIFSRLTLSDYVPGFAFSTVITLFLGSVQLLGIGILGQYIARIYDEVKNRPIGIIQRKKNFTD